MEPALLHVEVVRMSMQTAERIADLHARRYVTGMAACLTLAGGVVVTALTGQVAWSFAAMTVLASGVLFAALTRKMARLATQLDQGLAKALRIVESLMVSQEEQTHDAVRPGEGVDEGRER